MRQFFASYNGLEIFFFLCAVIGGAMVVVRLITQFAATGADPDSGVDADIDSHHADSDVGFEYLSIHGISSFFMMFGLVGLALYRQSQVGLLASIVGAMIGGYGALWVIGKIFRGAGRMQASGTLRTEDAVGSTGTVYLTNPAGGIGRVTIHFQSHLREFDAREKAGVSLATGTAIRVVQVMGNVMIVEKTA